jgi:hypothetical protein
MRLITGGVILVLLAFLVGRFGSLSFYTRWRGIKDGMTQQEVRKALGSPTLATQTSTIGAGDQRVTEWQYKRGRSVYCVDFDYIGPQGAPLVFRTESYKVDWQWPSWWPFARTKARA